jgi:signal transduction histidine kinase
MDQLIHDLLDYGRLGHVEVQLTEVKVGEVLDRVVYRSMHQLQQKKAVLKIDSPLPEVRANAEILEQILANLMDNALKFTAAGRRPQIRLSTEIKGGWARIYVQDNGIGIEPHHTKRIFEPFETLHPGSRAKGTGIGLAIVRQGILRMGGRAGVESEPGRGSRFWIELPLADSAEKREPALLDLERSLAA